MVSTLDLHEISMVGASFTWWNKRRGEALVYYNMDHCFGNLAIYQMQCVAKVIVVRTKLQITMPLLSDLIS